MKYEALYKNCTCMQVILSTIHYCLNPNFLKQQF